VSLHAMALLRTSVPALLIVLAACGGGGGGASPPSPAAPPPTASSGTLTVSLTAPSAYASGLAGSLRLAATATDAGGISAVEFQVDGQPAGAPLTAAPYATTIDTEAYASGQHVVRVQATNASGQVSGWASTTLLFGGSRAVPAGFTRNDTWLTGLGGATAIAQAPDGRFFIAQQGGSLRVAKNGALLPTPFVQLAVNPAGERGLIGVALHPGFASNGWVYLYYTTDVGGTHNRISRFTALGDVASAGSEQILVELPALGATNHNGGAMHFGSDGKLYVGVGENAVAARAQDPASPFGKLLRFNDDGSIPPDNPFQATRSGLARAIWASGLRNPYTFAFQPGTGVMYINDVGNATWEEIDVGLAGANYGWPSSEGPDGVAAGITAPIFSYKHSAASPPGSGPGGFFTGEAIIGGAFYPDAGNFPAAYRGSYFFADLTSQFVARLDAANGNAAYSFATLTDSPVGLIVGLDGALYVLTRSGVTRISAP